MGNSIRDFYDLKAWQEAHQLTLRIYDVTRGFPKEEMFGITSQLRRAASSIGANIAEGFGRFYFKDKKRFYYQSRGSVAEVQNFVFLCIDEKLFSREVGLDILEKSKFVNTLVNGLISSLDAANAPIE